MSHNTYPIQGIQAGCGPKGDPLRKVHVRREIDEWWASNNPNDINQKALFIYALDVFQTMDPKTEMKSYFQVAGRYRPLQKPAMLLF